MLLEEPLSNDRPAKASSMLAVPLSLPSSTSSKDALELRASDADRADAPRERDAISCDAELINVLIRVWNGRVSLSERLFDLPWTICSPKIRQTRVAVS
jgi:hypothetical protein